MSSPWKRIESIIRRLYPEQGGVVLQELKRRTTRLDRTTAATPANGVRFTESDALLITYADQFVPTHGTPLEALRGFADRYLRDSLNFIHILPFFEATSDDGFAVSDYRTVDPAFGTWDEILGLSRQFRLAFDLVLNHTSASHKWFAAFLAGTQPYDRYYLTRPADYDWSKVVRPRTHPLLTPFRRSDGSTVNVWTTFSADQVDPDFANPSVLLEYVDILLDYIRRGAAMIRLDAVAYLWKEDGTPCIHHPNTHLVVKLLRALVEHMGLDTVILTETNVPHADNISYFGNGTDEAHMVYNFALPPLVLHAFCAGHARYLSAWAATLPEISEATTFLNFLASHDGIGVTPTRGWLTEAELAELVATVEQRGGRVSYKSSPKGPEAYELNINYFSAISNPQDAADTRVRAFLSSQAIMLALAGVPGIYIHSLIGSQNWDSGPPQLGHNRAINREKLAIDRVETELADPTSIRARVFAGFQRLLHVRRAQPAFSPHARQRVLTVHEQLFCIARGEDGAGVLCLTNTAPTAVHASLPADARAALGTPVVVDLISGNQFLLADGPPSDSAKPWTVRLAPYQTAWFAPRARNVP